MCQCCQSNVSSLIKNVSTGQNYLMVEKQIGNEKDKTKWKLRTDIKLVNNYGTKRWKT